MRKTNKILILKLKETELENKLLKEQLEKAFPVVKLENIRTWNDIIFYLKKKYITILYLIEFIIIFCLKDLSRYIVYELKIAPSDFLKWIIKSLKGVN